MRRILIHSSRAQHASVLDDALKIRRVMDNLVRNAVDWIHRHRDGEGRSLVNLRLDGDFAPVDLHDPLAESEANP